MLLMHGLVSAQTNISGKVLDPDTEEPLIGCNILITETSLGTVTDIDGNFKLEVKAFPVTLVFSYIGYDNYELKLESAPNQPLNISLAIAGYTLDDEVVISASRMGEKLKESAKSIQKLTTKDITYSASGDFYQDMGQLKEIDMTTSSLGFRVLNTRGFNTTAPIRIVQYVDGVDNQAPGLNFPLGNLVGIPDIDLQNVEIISGASSTLYGANAFQGVISMNSKDPFLYPGFSAKIKGGSRQHFDGQMRYAQVLGKEKKFAMKVTLGYFEGTDWLANDTAANVYGDIEASVNVSKVVRELQFDEDVELAADFRAINAWLDFFPSALPGDVDVEAPGYMEESLTDDKTQSLKAAFAGIYKINEETEIEAQYRFGRGTATYQGSNRYSVNNILFHQPKVEFRWKDLNVKYYSTIEEAGDSYDLVFTAINLSKEGIGNYVSEWVETYFSELAGLTDTFSEEPRQWEIAYARKLADSLANVGTWLEPGSYSFDSAFALITSNPDLNSGARFQDKSSLHHVEANYDFKLGPANLITGASYRLYRPRSFGTIFRDTLVSFSDTLNDGSPDLNADFVKLNTYDVGAYAQAVIPLKEDKLKLTAGLRIDKSKNYPVQISPGLSLVVNWQQHTFRFSGQTSFRSPTLQNQYILLDLGAIILKGNLGGVTNAYTQESVEDFEELYEEDIIIDPTILEPIERGSVEPEQVYSGEFGYRGVWKKNLYIDLNAYINYYRKFIGDLRVIEPANGEDVNAEAGVDAVLTGDYNLLQYPVNAQDAVFTYGGSIGARYYFWRNLAGRFNFTYSQINTKKLNDPIIPGYNTPRKKFNIGLGGDNLWHGLGFNINFRWSEDFLWESPFGDGTIPSFHTMDAQVSYTFPKYIVLQVGGSNIYDNKHIEAFGSPTVGGIFYTSLLIDLERK